MTPNPSIERTTSSRMRPGYRLEPVDHRLLAIAQQLHAVQMTAYAQEARLLGATYFPPLARTVDELRACKEEFVAAFIEDELVGGVSVWPDRKASAATSPRSSWPRLTSDGASAGDCWRQSWPSTAAGC